MSSETININVIIADRPYRLRVKPEEEEHVRLAAKKIKEKMKELQSMYDAKDKQDYLAMTALMFGVDTLNLQETADSSNENVQTKLESLDTILTEFLRT